MSDVAGMEELENLSDYAWCGASDADRDRAEVWLERLEALLRNRQELVEMIGVIQELNEAEMLDADKIDELYAKAKELDNDQ